MIISFFHNLSCIVCQSIILGSIVKYNVSYKCSDKITNEVFRLENINTKKSIIYTSINLGADIFYILFNVFAILIILLKEKSDDSTILDKNKSKKADGSNKSQLPLSGPRNNNVLSNLNIIKRDHNPDVSPAVPDFPSDTKSYYY